MKNRDYPWYPSDPIADLRELVQNAAAKYGDQPALSYVDADEAIVVKSFLDLQRDIRALGTALAQLGYEGAHVAVIGPNSYRWLVTMLAVVSINGVIVPIDKELPVQDVEHILSDSACRCLFYADTHEQIATQVFSLLDNLETLVPLTADASVTPSFESLRGRGEEALHGGDTRFSQTKVDREKLAMLMYTSGTTGHGKAVMLSHATVATNVTQCCAAIAMPGDALLVLPFHHALGFISVFMGVHSGIRSHINQDLWSLADDFALIRPKIISLVPLFVERLYKKIWDNAEAQGKASGLRFLIKTGRILKRVGIDARRAFLKPVLKVFGGEIEVIFCGGAPMDITYERFIRDIGIHFVWGYGITECSPGVSTNRVGWYREKSVGHPFPGVEVRIDSPDDNGEGEILIRGPNVMLGYYKNPEATEAALVDGWFHSGDIGRIDGDGFLYLTGRAKNIILLSNGKNVYPEEIEMELMSRIRGIAEVVVRQAGQKIVAEIFPDTEYLEKHAIADSKSYFGTHVREVNPFLASHKWVNDVIIREVEFEKTTTRKIKRHAT